MLPCGCWQGREGAINFHVSCCFRQGGTILPESVEASTTLPLLDIDRIVLLPLHRLCGTGDDTRPIDAREGTTTCHTRVSPRILVCQIVKI